MAFDTTIPVRVLTLDFQAPSNSRQKQSAAKGASTFPGWVHADNLFWGVAFTAHFVLLSRGQNAPNSLNKSGPLLGGHSNPMAGCFAPPPYVRGHARLRLAVLRTITARRFSPSPYAGADAPRQEPAIPHYNCIVRIPEVVMTDRHSSNVASPICGSVPRLEH